MNKSFVLSGGRKNDRFESGFKPATLPDWQNGNVTGPSADVPAARLMLLTVGWIPVQTATVRQSCEILNCMCPAQSLTSCYRLLKHEHPGHL